MRANRIVRDAVVVEALESRRLLSLATNLVGSMPGAMVDIEVAGDRGYVVQGDSLVVLDVSGDTPVQLSTLYLGQCTEGLDVVGQYAYVVGGRYLQVIDIGDSASPRLVSSVSQLAYDVTVAGGYAYLSVGVIYDVQDASNVRQVGFFPGGLNIVSQGYNLYVDEHDGLSIWSLANPSAPTLLSKLPIDGVSDVAVDGNLAYVTTWDDELKVVDVTTAEAPVELASLPVTVASHVDLFSGGVIVFGREGLELVDVSDPGQPVSLGMVWEGDQGHSWSIAVSEDRAYIPAALSGLTVIDLSEFATPAVVGRWGNDGRAEFIAVNGNYAFVGNLVDRIQIVDISDAANPAAVSEVRLGNRGLAVSGNLLLAAAEMDGLAIFGISDPLNPVPLSTTSALGFAEDVAVDGQWVYVAGSGGLTVFDISDPAAPAITSVVPINSAYRVEIAGDRLYVSEFGVTATILDRSTPSDPHIVGTFEPGGPGLAVSGNYVYARSEYGFDLYDATDPAAPVRVRSVVDDFSVNGMTVSGNALYVLGYFRLQLYDISEPGNPVLADEYATDTISNEAAVAGEHIYVADGKAGLRIYQTMDFDLGFAGEDVAENSPAGTVVGEFSTQLPPGGVVYELVAGIGSGGNGSFVIEGNQLKTASVFDHEMTDSYSIRVRVSNAAGWSEEGTFVVRVLDVNEAPQVRFYCSRFFENAPIGTHVGAIVVSDPDEGEVLTLSLAGPDAALFAIANGKLVSNAVLNFEAGQYRQIKLTVFDGRGLNATTDATVTIEDLNEAPTNLQLSANKVAENRGPGTLVGLLSASDEDGADVITYRFVGGDGSQDYPYFRIEGNRLLTAGAFNFEAKNRYYIRLTAWDGHVGVVGPEKAYVIVVTDVEEKPQLLELSGCTVDENSTDAVVGTIVSTDGDASDTAVYSLVPGTGSDDNGLFRIDGDQLVAVGPFDYETRIGYCVRIRATDTAGLYDEQVFQVTLNDVDDREPLVVSGTDGNDVILVSLDEAGYTVEMNGVVTTWPLGHVRSLRIEGLAGDDEITLSTDAMAATILGGDGDDTITGGSGADLIYGDDGDDVISGLDGVDTIYGNFGQDQIMGGLKRDSLMGGLGNDMITAGDGPDWLSGGDGTDVLRGGKGADYIEGRGKADTIYGGIGNDTIVSGAGSDAVFGEDGDDMLYATRSLSFHDALSGGPGMDSYEADEDDLLVAVETNMLA